MKRTVFKALVHQEKTITFPQEGFDPVTAPAAEQKERISVIWIQFELKADDCSQTFNSAAKIRIPCRKVNVNVKPLALTNN